MHPRLLTALFLFAAGVAQAAPIYRCGPDGREYSQVPCAGGTVLEASDPRSAAQRAEAKRVAEQERKMAAEMERQRRADEKALKPAVAIGIGPTPTAAAASAPRSATGRKKPSRAKDDKPEDFVAVPPPVAKAK